MGYHSLANILHLWPTEPAYIHRSFDGWKDSFAQALHFIIIFFLSGCSGLVSFKENDYFFTRLQRGAHLQENDFQMSLPRLSCEY